MIFVTQIWGGRQGPPPPPSRSNSFHFHAVFFLEKMAKIIGRYLILWEILAQFCRNLLVLAATPFTTLMPMAEIRHKSKKKALLSGTCNKVYHCLQNLHLTASPMTGFMHQLTSLFKISCDEVITQTLCDPLLFLSIKFI